MLIRHKFLGFKEMNHAGYGGAQDKKEKGLTTEHTEEHGKRTKNGTDGSTGGFGCIKS
jgi:hypothetical protein